MQTRAHIHLPRSAVGRRAVAMLALVGAIWLAPTAGARTRGPFPVIGCDDLRIASGINHYSWRYAPRGYCDTAGALGTTAGIDHARWRSWGGKRATARGMLVDGLGFEYPATITAYDLFRCRDCFGIRGYDPSWYRRLHVVAAAEVIGGARRGPFDVVLDVTPEE